jgi:hypothetical protein
LSRGKYDIGIKMSNQAQLQAQIESIDTALRVLQVSLNRGDLPPDQTRTVLSQISRLQADRSTAENQLRALGIVSNPPDPQVPPLVIEIVGVGNIVNDDITTVGPALSGNIPTVPLSQINIATPVVATVDVTSGQERITLPSGQQTPTQDPQASGFVFDENGELIPADSAQAQDIIAQQSRVQNATPRPVDNFISYFDPENGWSVRDENTGEVVAQNLTEQQAILFAQDANTAGFDSAVGEEVNRQIDFSDAQEQANSQAEAKLRAQAQATFQKWRKQANDGDWRVRLRLAPNATYLYKAPNPGILQPLAVTDGVVFPYTPRITTAYRAEYSDYKLTHSNYRGFFYQSSYVDDIQLEATFTAQDTYEAEYLLAVIHFFRSATKMFYGANDPQAGSPPPIVYLQGLGEYQFNLQSCVVAQFNYNLPNDVDYIRARSKNISTNTSLQYLNRRDRQNLPTDPFSSAWSRIKNVLGAQGVQKGAVPTPPAPPTLGVGDSLNNNPTYVPTKLDMTLVLHPVQSRQQVSQQFNMQGFANGNLLRGGFW